MLVALSLVMALNASLDEPLVWPLYVFAFISAALYTFNRPALDTWPARLLDKELLPSADAVEWSLGTLDSMAGPIAAGFMLASIGAAGAFVFDAITFPAVIGMVLRMRPSPGHDEAEVSRAAIKEGFRFLKGKRNLRSVFLADLNAMIFGFPMGLFPAVALSFGSEARQEEVFGFLFAAPAAGALLTLLFSGGAKRVRRQGRAILVCIAIWGVAIVAFGLSHVLWLSLVMLGIAGAGDTVSGLFRAAILQTAVEDRFRGRLDGIGMAVWATGPSLGDVESWTVATLTSVQFSIVSGGILTVLGVLALRWFAPGFWHYDSRQPMP